MANAPEYKIITTEEAVAMMAPPQSGQTVCSLTLITGYDHFSFGGDLPWDAVPVMEVNHFQMGRQPGEIQFVSLATNSFQYPLTGCEFRLFEQNEVIELWRLAQGAAEDRLVARIEQTVKRQWDAQKARVAADA